MVSRRVPKQSRSRERFDLILDEAANLFEEKGFAVSTTNQIAERAGVSIGSLYQYFTNKEAIAEALMDRYVEGLRGVTNRILDTEVGDLSTATSVHLLTAPILEFHTSHPGFRTLWLEADVSRRLRAAMKAMDREIVRHVQQLLLSRSPSLPQERAQMIVTVVAATVKGLLGYLGRTRDDEFRERVSAEVQRMLTAYLDTVIPRA